MSTSFPPPTTVDGDKARALTLASSESQRDGLNKELAFRTTGAVVNWNANLDNGGFSTDPASPKYNPPPPFPFAWELDDPNPDGFVFYRVSRTVRINDPSLGFSFPAFHTVDRSVSQGEQAARQKAGGIVTAIGDQEHGVGNESRYHAFTGEADNPTAVDTNLEGTPKTITRNGETFQVVKVAGLGAIFGVGSGGGYWQRV